MGANDLTGPPDLRHATPAAYRRRWAVLAVLCTSLLLCGVDLTVLHAAVPSMTMDLHPSGVELLWIVDVYSLTLAALLVTCGTLGDRVGRKRMALTGMAVFGLASAAAAPAQGTAQLIGARMLLGAGAAMIMASTVAIIRVVFPDARERALAIGIWTSAHSLGATIGPLVGGAVAERWWWGAVFLVNVPIAAVVLAVGAKVIPESRNPTPRRWDLLGVLQSIAGLAGVVFAVKQAGEHLSLDLLTGVIGVAGTGLMAAFVVRQRRLAQPLLDLSLFSDRRFTIATVCVIGCFGGYTAMLFFFTQWFQWVGGRTPLEAGLALAPLAAANAAGAVLAPRAARRFGDLPTTVGALGLFAAGLAVMTVAGHGTGYGLVVAVLVAAGIGAGVIMTLGADSIMAAADPDRAGEAAAIQETSFELGAGLGVAVFGTVLAATYRIVLPPVPNLSPSAREAARESIGTAAEIADRLDPAAAALLRDAARAAYDTGFTVVTATAAILLAVLAALTAVALRPGGRRRVGAGRAGARGRPG
ncbi:MFS transporter [Sphaerisporangium fuscum]|uniref:MFS transporter n=1 Tax=Sphaerisporangium fuscum TaxID=2835868 RepID=UPI001BDDC998|nr:MFS transporter [Sphaerisporangium fuscum]